MVAFWPVQKVGQPKKVAATGVYCAKAPEFRRFYYFVELAPGGICAGWRYPCCMAEALSTKLERVQTAIAAIENGAQSYAIEGVTFQRADLKTLYERERSLLSQIDRAAGNQRRVAEFVE